jgi:hypothetical protein
MKLSKIRLVLARDPEFPDGSSEHGYEFFAPLDKNGRIDAKSWQALRARCRVKRFWGDEPEELGHLLHKRGGTWAFHYDIHGDAEDDEAGYRFGDHLFKPGEYVSIREHDEGMRTFRIAAVVPVDVAMA